MADYIQNTYTRKPGKAMPGQVESLNNADIESRALQTAAGVDSGVVLAAGTSFRTCKAIANSTDAGNAIGASVYKGIKEPISSVVRWAQKEVVPVLFRGSIWLKAQGDVTDDLRAVYVVHENAGTVLGAGQIRATAGSGDFEATAVGGIMVREGVAAGGLALCKLNLGPVGPQGEPGLDA